MRAAAAGFVGRLASIRRRRIMCTGRFVAFQKAKNTTTAGRRPHTERSFAERVASFCFPRQNQQLICWVRTHTHTHTHTHTRKIHVHDTRDTIDKKNKRKTRRNRFKVTVESRAAMRQRGPGRRRRRRRWSERGRSGGRRRWWRSGRRAPDAPR